MDCSGDVDGNQGVCIRVRVRVLIMAIGQMAPSTKERVWTCFGLVEVIFCGNSCVDGRCWKLGFAIMPYIM